VPDSFFPTFLECLVSKEMKPVVSFVPLSLPIHSSSSIESCTSPVLVDHHLEDNWSCKLLSCALSIQPYLMFVDGLITRVRVFMA
jgi:hypothetical protein